MILKFVAHSGHLLRIARRFCWLLGARYTNRRDVREFERIGFLDIEWKKYCFKRHLEAVKAAKPMVTVALDIHDPRSLPRILDQASELNLHSYRVIIVPQASLPAEQTRYGYSQEILAGLQRPQSLWRNLHSTLFFQTASAFAGRPPGCSAASGGNHADRQSGL